MPAKRKAAARRRKEATDSEDEVPQSKRPCPSKPRAKKSGPYKMPPPLPAGEVLTDLAKCGWELGKSVGKGGFGEIYHTTPAGKAQDANYVIKIVGNVKASCLKNCKHTHTRHMIYHPWFQTF